MNRTSLTALARFTSFVALVGSGCSSDDPPPSGAAGTGFTPTAGTSATAGTGSTTAGTYAGGAGTAGTSATAGTGEAAGAATGGGGAGGVATGGGGAGGTTTGGGGAGGAATGGGGAGGSGSGTCPAKIDSSTVCTAVASCPGTMCGIHKLGSRDCSCAAASGVFACTACTYKGAEPIVMKPDAALTPCAMADSAMEDLTGCTKGDRCKSLDTTKDRFCACWDAAGATAWDCDSTPSAWK
jgi:hypothetical protein